MTKVGEPCTSVSTLQQKAQNICWPRRCRWFWFGRW